MALDSPPRTGLSGSAAFFDLDRTLIPGSSLFLLAKGLRARDIYRAKDLARLAVQQVRARSGRGTNRDVERIRLDSLSFVTGRYQSELRDWGRQLATEEILPRVYPDIARIIAGHRAAGDLTFLVTASPAIIAEPIAQALEMDRAYGSVGEVDDAGRYTGGIVGDLLYGPEKARVISDLAQRENINLKRSHAYADTIHDRALLEAVGYPHAVNPDRHLLEVALRHGWAVHELRPVRRQLLVGVPTIVPVGALLGAGYLAGYAVHGRKKAP